MSQYPIELEGQGFNFLVVRGVGVLDESLFVYHILFNSACLFKFGYNCDSTARGHDSYPPSSQTFLGLRFTVHGLQQGSQETKS